MERLEQSSEIDRILLDGDDDIAYSSESEASDINNEPRYHDSDLDEAQQYAAFYQDAASEIDGNPNNVDDPDDEIYNPQWQPRTAAFTFYSGKGSELRGKGHASKVVMHLKQGKLGVGHILYMDNYYNSFPLASCRRNLLHRDLGIEPKISPTRL
ncbi:hypothetical protein J6590_074621 [Homalodisca vitripennis]|nr:hypothetical protein J6590_074621 [Homalodisca vitripennis]